MFIQTEATPNPDTMKFLPGMDVMGGLDVVYFRAGQPDIRSASPVAAHILSIGGISAVMLGSDFIAVTKDADRTWADLKPLVLMSVMEQVMQGAAFYIPSSGMEGDGKGSGACAPTDLLDAISIQIKELIETRVRPAVAQDGGDITFAYFKDGVAYVQMRGACAGCPSSSATLKNGIENMLRHFVPEVIEVRALDHAV